MPVSADPINHPERAPVDSTIGASATRPRTIVGLEEFVRNSMSILPPVALAPAPCVCSPSHQSQIPANTATPDLYNVSETLRTAEYSRKPHTLKFLDICVNKMRLLDDRIQIARAATSTTVLTSSQPAGNKKDGLSYLLKQKASLQAQIAQSTSAAARRIVVAASPSTKPKKAKTNAQTAAAASSAPVSTLGDVIRERDTNAWDPTTLSSTTRPSSPLRSCSNDEPSELHAMAVRYMIS